MDRSISRAGAWAGVLLTGIAAQAALVETARTGSDVLGLFRF